MKIDMMATIDTTDLCLNLSRKERKELIMDIDGYTSEVDFTLDICRELIQSLIDNGESNKEEIIKHIFDNK